MAQVEHENKLFKSESQKVENECLIEVDIQKCKKKKHWVGSIEFNSHKYTIRYTFDRTKEVADL